MDGGSLRDLVKRLPNPIIPESILSKITQKILNGIMYLHKIKHQVHRDIKPDNVLINSSGAVKVLIDREIIYRAIRSLFQISIKNTVSGYVKLGFTCKEEKLIFYVLDSGNGYAKYVEFFNSEDMNKSLSLFSDTYTAINIILLRKLVTILGGTIWIEHNEIEGAGIYFSIPAKYVSQTTNINTHSTILI